VQGAYRVSIDGTVVLDRDTRVWGIWSKFTAHVRLSRGRHRIVARLGGPDTSIRVMKSDGTPLGIPSSDDARGTYELAPPAILDDANVLDRFVKDGAPIPVDDDISRYLGAYLAHSEEEDDVAAVIIEPLVSEAAVATPASLAMAATIAEKDPIFPDSDRHDLARDLRQRAATKDPELWWPRFWLALDSAEKKGLSDSVEEVRKLADHFRGVPDIPEGLAQLYGRLSWTAERAVTLKDLATRFPRNPHVLQEVLEVLEDEGQHLEADRIAARIKALDPDNEIEVDRALSRHDYKAAIAELKRLGQRRPDRKDIADRVIDALTRAGEQPGSLAMLERAVAKKPRDANLRLGLADARFAAGDRLALRHAVADAILAGASTSELADAIELVEGTTELEPYRIDGPKVIKAYEASGTEMEGNAARVLDYSAVWIHPDGSSRMLEHELIRIQSQEAIGKMAEQKLPNGLLLKMRVIKKDGAILEPELVSGKQTATMPHLEIGDYIETESIPTKPVTVSSASATSGRTGSFAKPTSPTGAANSWSSLRRTSPWWSRRAARYPLPRSRTMVLSSYDAGASIKARQRRKSRRARPFKNFCRASGSVGGFRSPITWPAWPTQRATSFHAIRAWCVSPTRSHRPATRGSPARRRVIKGHAESTAGSSRTWKTDAKSMDDGSWWANRATAPLRSSTCVERWAFRSRWQSPKTG